MKQIEKTKAFILKHYPPAREWEDMLEPWLRWHASHGFILGVLNDQQQYEGLAIVRPVMKASDAYDFYEYDPEGPCLYIDLAAATSREALTVLGFCVLKRFGERQEIAYKRFPQDEIRTHNFDRFRRNILRKTSNVVLERAA